MTSLKNQIKKIIQTEKIELVGKESKKILPDHHTFYSLAKNKDNQLMFFKILTTNVDFKIQTFKREVLFLKFLKANPGLGIFVPAYQNSSLKKNDFWVLRMATTGKIFGNRLYFSKKFYTGENLKILAAFILKLQQITRPAKIFFKKNNLALPTKSSSWFLAGFRQDYDFSAFFGEIENKLLKNSWLEEINYYIQKNKKLLNQNLVLTHGDLQAANLLFEQKKLTVIDWENLHLNNYLFDWGYIWLNSWPNPSWRQKLEKLILKTAEDRILFSINKIRWLIRMVGLLQHGQNQNPRDKKNYQFLEKIKNKHLKDLKKILNQLP